VLSLGSGSEDVSADQILAHHAKVCSATSPSRKQRIIDVTPASGTLNDGRANFRSATGQYQGKRFESPPRSSLIQCCRGQRMSPSSHTLIMARPHSRTPSSLPTTSSLLDWLESSDSSTPGRMSRNEASRWKVAPCRYALTCCAHQETGKVCHAPAIHLALYR